MKEKWTPHIIAVMAFMVFIVLGLACASSPPSHDYTKKYTITINGSEFTYKFVKNNFEDYLVIIDYRSVDGNTTVVIPDKIRNTSVREIGKDAFRNKGLTKVTFETRYTFKIGSYAFANNEIQEISGNLFFNYHDDVGIFSNNKLKSVSVLGFSRIRTETFANNEITSVTLRNRDYGEIETGAFSGNNITEVIIDGVIDDIDPLVIAGFGLGYVLNGKVNGTYTYRDDGWYLGERRLPTTFAELVGGTGVIIKSIDGVDSTLYRTGSKSNGLERTSSTYLLPPGRHTIEVRYYRDRTRSIGSVNFNQVYLFEAGRYRITATEQEDKILFEIRPVR